MVAIISLEGNGLIKAIFKIVNFAKIDIIVAKNITCQRPNVETIILDLIKSNSLPLRSKKAKFKPEEICNKLGNIIFTKN